MPLNLKLGKMGTYLNANSWLSLRETFAKYAITTFEQMCHTCS